MVTDRALLDWMLDSDPALRWRVERDLAAAPPGVWQSTRARVATEGIGARLLALQDPDGQWAGGAFFPRDFDFDGPEAAAPGQPWTATTWSLKALRDWGADASALAGTAEKIAANSRWEYDDLPYWDGEVDACINGFTLATGAWLGVDMAPLAQWFVEHRMAEGGWNCEWVEGSTRASVRSTLNSLVGILDYERRTGGTDALRAARHAGEEYLLVRHLNRALRSDEPIRPEFGNFWFPLRSQYNALTALDYFREASLHDDTPPDPRLADAVALLRAAQRPDGTWLQGAPVPGRVWFDVDVPEGAPSPWLTFFATRILDWWDADENGGTA
ncbi:MAG: squalene cyclase [Microbacterium sp.]